MNTERRGGPSSTGIGRAGRTLLAMFLGVCGVLGAARDARADAPAPKRSAAKYEVRFMTGMIDHHEMAVMTGTICTQEAVHDELATLCDQIVTTQAAEIDTMQSWLQDWYGVDHETEMKRRHERMIKHLAALEGAAFEVEFMEMMIDHHEQAVKQGGKCLDKAYHEELLDLCEGIVESQQEEIELMEGWLCEWYDIC